MNLDERWIYIFIRQDLPDWQQLVHSNHAALAIGVEIPGMVRPCDTMGGHPNLVLIGVADEKALQAAAEDFRQREVRFRAWKDPDAEHLGLLSLVTEPMDKRERNKLHHYRPWSRSNNTFGKRKAEHENTR